MAGNVEHVNDVTLEATVASGVALIDFWAEWCAPCRMQLPILEHLAAKVAGRAKVAKLNVDEAPNAAASFGIRSIPTLILFKEGKPVQQFIGVQSEATLLSAIEAVL